MINLNSAYGINDQTARSANPVGRIVEEILYRGFAVIPHVLSASKVDQYCEKLDRIYEEQCSEVGGVEKLRRITDEDIVRCPLGYDRAFIEMATEPRLLEIIKSILGDNIVLTMQNGIINHPERLQFQTKWHRDLNYQHWVCSKPLCLSALFCLEDFTPETGGTVFLPSSQKEASFPSEHLIEAMAFAPSAPSGSVIVFDAMTYHRAGVNTSGRIRRAVNHVIGVPILAQTIDLPSMLGERPTDPWLAGYLGYRWNPVPSVAEWRRRKLDTATPSMVKTAAREPVEA